MPPKVKFPLDMGNDVLVRNIDELKENFNIEKVVEYFLSGKLLIWLNDRYYDEESEQVEGLSSESDKSLLADKLCNIFGIEKEKQIDVEALERRRERLEKLRSITSDDEILNNVDYVAFSQEELGDLLDYDADVIYLCGEKFRIPLSVKNKKYIGINTPVVDISSKEDKINLKKCGIVVEKCTFSEKTQAKMKTACEGVVEIDREYVETDYDLGEIIYDTEDEDYDEKEALKADTRPYKELNNEKVTGIIIPDGVTRIGECAFRGFKHLKTIKIPESVVNIGYCSFEYCESLEEIIIPENVTVIEGGAFGNCRSIKSIVIPDKLTEIDNYAFGGCRNLESVNIPNGITVIDDGVFSECDKLVEISIPDSVTEIGDSAFYKCKNLESVIIPKEVTIIKDSAFCGCNKLSKIIISDGVTEIGSWTFNECEKLKSITIPDSVVKIGLSAFVDCKELENVKLSQKLEEVDLDWFSGCQKLYTFEIPYGITKVSVVFYDSAITSLTIPESVAYDSFVYSPSKDDPIRELNLPLSYKKDFAYLEADLPSECKLNYYSGTTVFTDKEKRSLLTKYLKSNSYKTGLKTYSWYYGSQISSTAKNNIKNRVQGLNKTSDIIAAYDKNLSLFSDECKGRDGIVFTTDGFAVYNSSMTNNTSTPLINYESFSFILKGDYGYDVWLKDSDIVYTLFEEDSFNVEGFEELIENIVNMEYAK